MIPWSTVNASLTVLWDQYWFLKKIGYAREAIMLKATIERATKVLKQ